MLLEYPDLSAWFVIARRWSLEREAGALSSLDFLLSRMDDYDWVGTLNATRAFVSKQRVRQLSDREWSAYVATPFEIGSKWGLQVTPEMEGVLQHIESLRALDPNFPSVLCKYLFEYCLLAAPESLARRVLCRMNSGRDTWIAGLAQLAFLGQPPGLGHS